MIPTTSILEDKIQVTLMNFDGYIQDVRIYNGITKYTASRWETLFVVPSTSSDVLPDTPSGVSGSSKLTKITDGAVAFDGTNDTLSVPKW